MVTQSHREAEAEYALMLTCMPLIEARFRNVLVHSNVSLTIRVRLPLYLPGRLL